MRIFFFCEASFHCKRRLSLHRSPRSVAAFFSSSSIFYPSRIFSQGKMDRYPSSILGSGINALMCSVQTNQMAEYSLPACQGPFAVSTCNPCLIEYAYVCLISQQTSEGRKPSRQMKPPDNKTHPQSRWLMRNCQDRSACMLPTLLNKVGSLPPASGTSFQLKQFLPQWRKHFCRRTDS